MEKIAYGSNNCNSYMSWHGKAFDIFVLRGETNGHQANHAAFFYVFFAAIIKKLLKKQSSHQWFQI